MVLQSVTLAITPVVAVAGGVHDLLHYLDLLWLYLNATVYAGVTV